MQWPVFAISKNTLNLVNREIQNDFLHDRSSDLRVWRFYQPSHAMGAVAYMGISAFAFTAAEPCGIYTRLPCRTHIK